jgi:hypothetical protein
LREARPKSRSEVGRSRAVWGRLRTEETAISERSANLVLESVKLGVAEEAELKGEVLADEESSDDSDSAGLC